MSNSELIINLQTKMSNSVQFFKDELDGMRTNRASAGLVSGLLINYHGTDMKLSELGQISVSEGKMIIIQLWDKTAVESTSKELEKANLGMQPNVDGDKIRLVVPPLTEERRLELVKSVKKKTEDAKISARNIRRAAMEEVKDLEKEGSLSQDESRRYQTEIQKETDSTIENISNISQRKETELMEV